MQPGKVHASLSIAMEEEAVRRIARLDADHRWVLGCRHVYEVGVDLSLVCAQVHAPLRGRARAVAGGERAACLEDRQDVIDETDRRRSRTEARWRDERTAASGVVASVIARGGGRRRAAAGGEETGAGQREHAQRQGERRAKESAQNHDPFIASGTAFETRKKFGALGHLRARSFVRENRGNRVLEIVPFGAETYRRRGAKRLFCCVTPPHSGRYRALEMDNMRTLKLLALTPFALALACGGSEPAPASPSTPESTDSGAASAAPADTSAAATPPPADTTPPLRPRRPRPTRLPRWWTQAPPGTRRTRAPRRRARGRRRRRSELTRALPLHSRASRWLRAPADVRDVRALASPRVASSLLCARSREGAPQTNSSIDPAPSRTMTGGTRVRSITVVGTIPPAPPSRPSRGRGSRRRSRAGST